MTRKIIRMINEHYHHSREKQPYFCDMITCLSEDGANTHLDIYKSTLAAEIRAMAVEASIVWDCKYYEAIQAYTRGDTAAAVEKFCAAIAVLLRTIDVLEGRQALGDPAKKEGK